MFGIKTKLYNFLERSTENIFLAKRLPQKPVNFFKRRLLLFQMKRVLEYESQGVTFQVPITPYVQKFAQEVATALKEYNPNNLGNWSIDKPYQLSAQLEKTIIDQLIHLYNAPKKKIAGYITSGSTEGNLFTLWMGRNYLYEKYNSDQIILIKTELTHYSVSKSANITGVESIDIALDEDNLCFDVDRLIDSLNHLHSRGKRGFLVCLTLGYTVTGTDDPIELILEAIEKFKQKKDVDFFIWIDSAFSGVIRPFLDPKFSPFSNELISSFATDFHKFLGVPYPSGLILYRKKYHSYISQEVPYIGKKDLTLLGSRSGMSAIKTWYVLQSLGHIGINELIRSSFMEKEKFISTVQRLSSTMKIISNKWSVQIALIPMSREDRDLLKNMSIVSSDQKITISSKKTSLHKVFFLPKKN